MACRVVAPACGVWELRFGSFQLPEVWGLVALGLLGNGGIPRHVMKTGAFRVDEMDLCSR